MVDIPVLVPHGEGVRRLTEVPGIVPPAPGLLLTPHIGGAVPENLRRAYAVVAEQLAFLTRGELPPNLVQNGH